MTPLRSLFAFMAHFAVNQFVVYQTLEETLIARKHQQRQ
jgi:hypothetical protein